jgi:hypothetical protein
MIIIPRTSIINNRESNYFDKEKENYFMNLSNKKKK